MKLIQVHEVAKRIGVTRQTINNWIAKGIIQSKKIGRSTYLCEDEIMAISFEIADVSKATERIAKEKQELTILEEKLKEQLLQVRADLRVLPKLKSSVINKDFYLSIVDMIGDNPDVKERERQILNDVITGKSLQDICDCLSLTRERVRQIICNVIRKASKLTNLKEENERLRLDISKMSTQIEELQKENDLLRKDNSKLDIVHYPQILNTRLDNFGFSVRLRNCLSYSGFRTLGDVVVKDKSEIKKIRNFGKKSFEELESFLQSKGLHFGMFVPK